MKAATEIVLAFPSERVGVYFISGEPKTRNTPKTLNKGKLWIRHVNQSSKLRGCEKLGNVADNDGEEGMFSSWVRISETDHLNWMKIQIYFKIIF